MSTEQIDYYLDAIQNAIPVALELDRLRKINDRIHPIATTIGVFFLLIIINYFCARNINLWFDNRGISADDASKIIFSINLVITIATFFYLKHLEEKYLNLYSSYYVNNVEKIRFLTNTKYLDIFYLNKLAYYIQSGRASSFNDALNYIDTEMYRNKKISELRDINQRLL